MVQPYFETFQEINELGVHIAYVTSPCGYHSLHWHEEIELLYLLNGKSDIKLDGKTFRLRKKHLTVIESCKAHSTYAYSDATMYLSIHISKKYMQKYFPDIESYQIQCIPDLITDEQFPEYLHVCRLMEDLTKLYIQNAPIFLMEAEGIILQILARLIRHFAVNSDLKIAGRNKLVLERIRMILDYVENHFREPITLEDASETLGLNREYFCRFFKKNMGISFMQYVNEVRASHVYESLIHTDSSIAELAEKNGFFNQKQFNKTFRDLYCCTPTAVRKIPDNSRIGNMTAARIPTFKLSP